MSVCFVFFFFSGCFGPLLSFFVILFGGGVFFFFVCLMRLRGKGCIYEFYLFFSPSFLEGKADEGDVNIKRTQEKYKPENAKEAV